MKIKEIFKRVNETNEVVKLTACDGVYVDIYVNDHKIGSFQNFNELFAFMQEEYTISFMSMILKYNDFELLNKCYSFTYDNYVNEYTIIFEIDFTMKW